MSRGYTLDEIERLLKDQHKARVDADEYKRQQMQMEEEEEEENPFMQDLDLPRVDNPFMEDIDS